MGKLVAVVGGMSPSICLCVPDEYLRRYALSHAQSIHSCFFVEFAIVVIIYVILFEVHIYLKQINERKSTRCR